MRLRCPGGYRTLFHQSPEYRTTRLGFVIAMQSQTVEFGGAFVVSERNGVREIVKTGVRPLVAIDDKRKPKRPTSLGMPLAKYPAPQVGGG